MNFVEYATLEGIARGWSADRPEALVGGNETDAEFRARLKARLAKGRHHGVTPEQVRVFRPDVCCEHAWVHGPDSDFYGPDRCLECGATCTRGRDGQIEEYEAAVG